MYTRKSNFLWVILTLIVLGVGIFFAWLFSQAKNNQAAAQPAQATNQPTAAQQAAANPTAVPAQPTATPGVQPTTVSQAQTLDRFVYIWAGSSTNPSTPKLFDAQSTGKGITKTFDIGVKVGQLGVLKGYTITYAGNSFGGSPNGCAGPVILTPGYYYGITMTDARWEV
ncbi:hypothetical protein MUP56_01910, partial [Patescibacteria group bacterium]|nr:hypothetical protein [Patescibacteria group bacterium]